MNPKSYFDNSINARAYKGKNSVQLGAFHLPTDHGLRQVDELFVIDWQAVYMCPMMLNLVRFQMLFMPMERSLNACDLQVLVIRN